MKLWIFDVVLFILWTTALILNLIKGEISVLSYVLMYLAFLCELFKNFLWHTQLNKIEKNNEH